MDLGNEIGRKDANIRYGPENLSAISERVNVSFCQNPPMSRSTLEATVRSARKSRELRRELLGEDLFSGPGWSLLLCLFESHTFQRRDTIGSASYGADLAPTTALRWINRLERCDFIRIRDDHLDSRRRFVEMTDAGLAVMTKYFETSIPHQIAA